MRRSWFWLLMLVVGGAAIASGQSSWTATPSGTTATLRSICFGRGRYVAVGDDGMFVSSVDAATWTNSNAGSYRTFRSVAFGYGQFRAVGERGMLLRSFSGTDWEVLGFGGGAPNAVLFSAGSFMVQPPEVNAAAYGAGGYVKVGAAGILGVTAATGALNGIAFARDRFVAVGASGAIWLSRDGRTWEPRASGVVTTLRGVTFANNQFVVVGDAGAILTSPTGEAWTSRASGTTADLLAVSSGENGLVAVGVGGIVLHASAEMAAPIVITAPANTAEAAGGTLYLRAEVGGGWPLQFQWQHNGQTVATATDATLVLTHVDSSQAGAYTLRATNAAGTVTTAAAQVSIVPGLPPIVDPTFRADASLDGVPYAVLELLDRRVLVAENVGGKDHALLRLSANGQIDPEFSMAVMGHPQTVPAIYALAQQRDGKIFVGGEFTSFGATSRAHLLRLNNDGTIDNSFSPPAEVTDSAVSAIVVQPDGRILVANGAPRPIRLLSDGRIDSEFHPPAWPAPTWFVGGPNLRVFTFALAPNGQIYVASEPYLRPLLDMLGTYDGARIDRLNADGTPDGSFQTIAGLAAVKRMKPLSSGALMVAGDAGYPVPIGWDPIFLPSPSRVLRRYDAAGSLDPAYHPASVAGQVPSVMLIDDQGRAYGPGYLTPADPSSWRVVVRWSTDGSIDPAVDCGIMVDGSAVATQAANNQLLVAGSFTLFNGISTAKIARLNLVASDATSPPAVAAFWSERESAKVGEDLIFHAAISGSGSMTYSWHTPAGNIFTAEPTLNLRTIGGKSGMYSVTVRNTKGAADSLEIPITILPADPIIASQPSGVSFQSGRVGDIIVQVNSDSQPSSGEWIRDGRIEASFSDVSGDIKSTLIARADQAGTYTVRIRNAAGASVTSAPIAVRIDDTSRFANLSTRAFVGTGDRALIAGFVIPPPARRTLIIRGIGPGLAQFGVGGALTDPKLTVFDSGNRVVASNDDWGTQNNVSHSLVSAATFAQLGAFALQAGSKDAALSVINLAPGNYTVQLSGTAGETGSGLIEIYEYDARAERITNLSSRVFVSASAVAIPGFAVQGSAAKKILVRVVGPTLETLDVPGALANPRVELKSAAGATIAANDDWDRHPNWAELRDVARTVGAFALPAGSKDAALLLTVQPGNYTAVVGADAGDSGVTLLEVYEVP